MRSDKTKNKFIQKFVLFSFFAVVFLSGCGVLKEDSTWQAKPITTDKNTASWPDSASFKGAENILYDVRNDKDNLYLCFKAYDNVTQEIIIKGGLTVWFDVLGKKNETMGIAYPLPSEDRKIARRSQRQQQGDEDYIPKRQSVSPLRQELLLKTQMDLIGFQPGKTVRVPYDTTAGPRVNLQFDSFGSLNYIAVIPFSSLHYHPLKGKEGRRQKFTVGFVTGHLILPVQKMKSHGSAGGGDGGGSGMSGMGGGGGHLGGGGRHGGGGSGAGPDINDNSDEPIKIWFSLKFPGKKS